MVEDVNKVYSSLGKKNSLRSDIESVSKTFRRSIYFVKDLKKGEIITSKHIRRIRPGFGLEPKYYFDILGKKATRNIKRGERVTKDSYANTKITN